MTPIERYSAFFASLTSDFSDESFYAVFATDAIFEDPFQKVYGRQSIIGVFRHMYSTLKNPHFEILESMGNTKSGYIRWTFIYNDEHFSGVSHVLFDSHEYVISHIDYWDAGSNVYEKIPLLGSLLRLIKSKIKAS